MSQKLVLKAGERRNFFFRHATGSLEVRLAEGASCDIVLLDTSSGDSSFQGTSILAAGARVRWCLVTLGKGRVTQEIRSEICGSGAASFIDWIFHATSRDTYLLTARNTFLGEQGRGEITMKGVAEDEGHAKAHGTVAIGPKGNGTNTYLTQNVLMLDATAKVDAVPGLEIKTNDVKASHSASIARVTSEDLFYFGARGIDEREARRMFVGGFLEDLVQRISPGEVRYQVLRSMEEKRS